LQGRIFIFFKGGVEKLLVGCKRRAAILGVKKNFPERSIVNIAQFFREYCATTFILTTNCGIFGFLAF
jgi:hypothetical protein